MATNFSAQTPEEIAPHNNATTLREMKRHVLMETKDITPFLILTLASDALVRTQWPNSF